MNSLFSKIYDIESVYGALKEHNTCVSGCCTFLQLNLHILPQLAIRKWVFIEIAQCFSRVIIYMLRLSYERSILIVIWISTKVKEQSQNILIIEFAQSWILCINLNIRLIYLNRIGVNTKTLSVNINEISHWNCWSYPWKWNYIRKLLRKYVIETEKCEFRWNMARFERNCERSHHIRKCRTKYLESSLRVNVLSRTIQSLSLFKFFIAETFIRYA